MKDTFKLYINNKLVDFETEPKFEFKYQQEDLSNPTSIKNNFTKSIKIDGTDNNNQIFGEIYNLDREQLYRFNGKTGAYFNPSKRTPFELYRNSELIESGYMQLTDITIKNHKISYSITLYGGLGDFFYSLMYNDDDEKLTLADLWYKIEENGNVLPKDTELDFKINKDFVSKSWTKLKEGASGNSINDFISFAPAYNGLYEDFDTSSILVNTWASEAFGMENSKTEDDVDYSTFNGYKMAKTNREWTEWEVRDLRSYMQRPCLKFNKLFNAICDPDNNGGYKVNLDPLFFNENNPYYSQTYMALPLLPTSLKDKENIDEEVYKLFLDSNYYSNNSHIGNKGGYASNNATYRLGFYGDILNATSGNSFIINASSIPVTSTFDVKLDFDLKLVANYLNDTYNTDELYLTYVTGAFSDPNSGYTNTKPIPTYRSISVQAVISEIGGESYYSNMLNFTNQVEHSGVTYTSTADKWRNVGGDDISNVTNVYGTFKRQEGTYNYKFTDKYGNSNFYLDIKDVPVKTNMAISLMIKYRSSDLLSYDNYKTPVISRKILLLKPYNESLELKDEYAVNSYITAPLYNTSELIWTVNAKSVRSNTSIKKNQLLKTDFSPCDVLLDYCKLFGLYFTKDIHSKTINILTKNSFFTGNTIDISDRIDYSKDINIKPFLFEAKYYLMKSEPNETYYSKLYEKEYNLIYGQKRINTNYNFNKDTKNVYEGSVFQNAISVTDTSPYYRTFWQGGYFNKMPAWIMSSPTMELSNGAGTDSMKVYEWPYPYTRFIDPSLTVDWNIKGGYDMWPKTCFYNTDNNSKSLSDITASLLFFNGFKKTQDAGVPDETQATIPYWVTDDLIFMNTLNNGEVCYLYTEVYRDKLDNTIAIKYTELPQFLRYNMNGNTVTESLDFGLPREIYMPNVTYDEDATLYNKFWKKYLTDRYDVNTRKVTCYVNLKGMNITQDTMRDFYYFNNCVWVINKIENHLSNSYDTTKVEFVKVNDTDSYMNAQQAYQNDDITLNEYEATVDYNTTKYVIDLKSATPWTSSVQNDGQEVDPSEGEQGTYRIELETEANTESERMFDNVFTFTNESGHTAEFHLKQLPSPSNAKLMYGYVYDDKTELPVKDYTISIKREIELEPTEIDSILIGSLVKSNDEGYWQLYVPKSFTVFYVSVKDTNNEEVYLNSFYWNDLDYKQQLDIPV